ncbi:MAG TPA: rod-binding protein [Verrucomicrobiae bacterium]
MNIPALHQKVDASHIQLESLAGNRALTENQKIAEASRQFEAILLRQFLSESQRPVIQSEIADNSAASGIYQDFITNQLADSLSRNGGIGLAATFERQLTHPKTAAPAAQAAEAKPAAAMPVNLYLQNGCAHK